MQKATTVQGLTNLLFSTGVTHHLILFENWKGKKPRLSATQAVAVVMARGRLLVSIDGTRIREATDWMLEDAQLSRASAATILRWNKVPSSERNTAPTQRVGESLRHGKNEMIEPIHLSTKRTAAA